MKRRTFLTLLASAVSERALAQATVVSSCGSVTLTAGTPHNVTIDGNGQSCQSGASGGAPTSVWSASDAAANGMTLSNGGLTVTPASPTAFQTVRGSIGKSSGLLYVEFAAGAAFTSNNVNFGLASSGFNPVGYLGQTIYSVGMYPYQGTSSVSTGFTVNYGIGSPAPSAIDVIGFAINFTAGTAWISFNGVWAGGSNPATGTLPLISFVPATVGALFPAACFYDATKGVWTLQPTAASQKYAPPAGFTPWG